MSEALLRELAEQIAHEQFLSQWKIYLLMLALAFVGSALAGYWGSYLKKRGENLATKTDFNNLLTQLKANTIATEEIKTKVSHIDWATKERKILLRNKLEELLQSLYELADWQDAERSYSIFGTPTNPVPSPLPKTERLLVLYFPELRLEINDYIILYRSMIVLLLKGQSKIIAARKFPEHEAELQNSISDEYLVLYEKQISAIVIIENSCHKIMTQLVNI